MTRFEVVEIQPMHCAAVRDRLPMSELTSFFGGAFSAVMEEVGTQGLTISGPPFGYYASPPTDVVDVAAGFPVSGPVTPTGEVTALDLPGGQAVTAMHVGSYDTLEQTYGELMKWVTAEGIDLAPAMWESYLTDPSQEPDATKWETLITWPLQ